MFMARLAGLRNAPLFGLRSVLSQGSLATRAPILKVNPPQFRPQQGFFSKAKFGFGGRTARDQIKEAAFQPATNTAIKNNLGRLVLAGGAAVGLGALCYSRLSKSKETDAAQKAVIWPQYVKDRIHSTYMYFAGSVGLTALSAVAVSRNPAIMRLMMSGSRLAFGANLVAITAADMLVRSISYENSPVPKHLAWMLHAGVMGAVIAPITLLRGPLMLRAAWQTADIIGSLSTVAMCASSENFYKMGGPLAAGFGAVFASSLGTIFFPPTSAFGAGLYSVAVYAGLVLFSMLLLYDTQKVIKTAETHPLHGVQEYDPINACMGIYMDTLNIFNRMVMILTTGRCNRRK